MKLTLPLHPVGQGYIGRLNIPIIVAPEETENNNNVQTIVVLDRSGSMGQHAALMANIVIPSLLREYLGFKNDDSFTLITFDTVIQTIKTTIREVEKSNIQCRGCTYMAGVFDAILDSLDHDIPSIRILAISDGEIYDTQETLKAASLLSARLKESFSISAGAVRLFTSSSQPDTRALASILQLNTSSPGSLIDIKADDDLVNIMDSIGKMNYFSSQTYLSYALSASRPCMSSTPWAEPRVGVQLRKVNDSYTSAIWFDSLPEELALNGLPVEVELAKAVTHDTVGVLLEDEIEYFMDQLRLLKVVNSDAAKAEMMKILNYFKQLEDSLPPPTDLAPLLEDGSLTNRLKFMSASLSRKLKSISQTMENIANDERIANLNLAQQADYLRQAGTGQSRTARGLARRADASGLDFAAVMRAEIMSMAANIGALDEVDDSDHAVSFFSQATTLDGIRCMVELAQNPELLHNLSAPEMLRLFNVVGIPAVGPIGDFPDPMTYRLEKFLYGTYISIADTTSFLHQQKAALTLPGAASEEIVTAVPFFENRKIQKFLQRYARSSLEYMHSIGMRRMIAEVPKTYPYTICAGLWKLVEEVDRTKTEICLRHFSHLVCTYEEAVEGHFDHILPHLQDNQDPALSYYLGHNGITNMIAPILYLVRNKKTQFMPRVLRALYSFESYQVMRRVVRDMGVSGRQDTLDELLGVDFNSDRATPLPPLFERTEVEHCSSPKVNKVVLEKYVRQLWFVKYVTLLQPMFTALLHSENDKDFIATAKAIPPISPAFTETALGLPGSGITLDNFMLYNVVEALRFGNKQARIDKDKNVPKLQDLGNPNVGTTMIREYVHQRYAANYEQRLKEQVGQEQRILQDELIDQLLKTRDMIEFSSLVKEGHCRGPIAIAMDRDSCAGFGRLHSALMDPGNSTVRERIPKLKLIYLGRTLTGDEIFNGGNLFRCNWEPLKRMLADLDEEGTKAWKELETELSNRGHVYRFGDCNRHGHSNELRSYFAFGCLSLEDYHTIASAEHWSDYVIKHQNCCGVSEYVAQLGASEFGSKRKIRTD